MASLIRTPSLPSFLPPSYLFLHTLQVSSSHLACQQVGSLLYPLFLTTHHRPPISPYQVFSSSDLSKVSFKEGLDAAAAKSN